MVDGVVQALARVLAIDSSYGTSPPRLERALLDLAPDDQRSARWLIVGAQLGIPALLAKGHRNEAHAVLTDDAGMRDDVADWVIAAWMSALPAGDSGGPPSEHPHRSERSRRMAPFRLPPVPIPVTLDAADASDRPGVPCAIRLAIWPDGAALVGIVTEAGVFAAGGACASEAEQDATSDEDTDRPPESASDVTRWRRVGMPSAPSSRDVAVAVCGSGRPGAPPTGTVIWSERNGVFRRTVRQDDTDRLSLDTPELVAAPPIGTEPRHPVTALYAPDATLDVIWTVDRANLLRSVIRPGFPDRSPSRLPSACGPGEHLRGLEIALLGTRSAVLTALSSRGVPLIAEWDLNADFQPWRTLRSRLLAVTALAWGGGALVLGITQDGRLTHAGAVGALAGRDVWQLLDLPQSAPDIGRLHTLAATGDGSDRAWVAVVGVRGGWIAPLLGGPDRPRLGRARRLAFD